jgi:hypothetical protein
MAKPRALTDAEARLLRKRHQLYMDNHPKKLMAEFGIARNTLRAYVNDRHRELALDRKIRPR